MNNISRKAILREIAGELSPIGMNWDAAMCFGPRQVAGNLRHCLADWRTR